MVLYIGIDPGADGAMAVIDDLLDWVDVHDYANGETLEYLKTLPKNSFVMLEKVSAMPKQGVVSMFKFGANFGTWIGRLEALAIPFDFVTPRKWQNVIYDSAPRKGMDNKARSLERARRLFPCAAGLLTRKKDHNRADALLIAEYCRRMRRL
jgi:crossover junction endodeoxyribonuclease RuvC